MKYLENKTAVIIGGTAGIGKAMAKLFVQQGARVIIAGRRDNKKIIQEINAVAGIRVDITSEDQLAKAFKYASLTLGKLDIVINNAGVYAGNITFKELSNDDLQSSFDVNIRGVAFSLKHAPLFMTEGGSIINTSSVSGTITVSGDACYGISKSAINLMTKTAAIELASQGIRVNAIAPGGISGTDMSPEEAFIGQLAPMGRLGTPREVAVLALFLASDLAKCISGQVINIDGGLSSGVSKSLLNKFENMG